MSGRYASYPEAKESGVQWLGAIPKHWDAIQSRRLFSQRKERMRPGDEQLTASQKYGVIPQSEFMRMEGQKVMQVFTGADILKHVEPNDFVISMRSFQGGLEWCGHSGCVSSAYVGITPAKNVDSGFFKYLFKSTPYIQALQSTSNLVRDGQALRFQNFAEVALPLVQEEEQARIAKFLDYETAKIDALIEKQQQLIAVLKEKRQAVISHTIAKGLNVDSPMRDSGIDWLGEMPGHWQLTKLKYVSTCLDGQRIPLNATERGEMQGGIPYWGANRIVDYVDGYLFDEDLVLLGEDGAPFFDPTRDVAFFVTGKIWPNNHVHVLRPTSLVEGRFLAYALNCVQYHLHITGSTRDKLNQSDMNEIVLRLCPKEEQAQIVEFLDSRVSKIDALMARSEDMLEVLAEGRAALISAAVTGKIDVRGWKAPKTEQEAEVA